MPKRVAGYRDAGYLLESVPSDPVPARFSLPNVQSAEKRARQNVKAREDNKRDRSRLKTALKKVREADNAEAARAALHGAERLLDRLAAKGVIHRNTAARHKSRLNAAVARRAA
jgi:small subunit ribosomal protein S20